MSTSYPLFNALTVSLTYWVILRTGQRVFCLDNIVALYYQFYVEKKRGRGRKIYSVKLIRGKTTYQWKGAKETTGHRLDFLAHICCLGHMKIAYE